MKKFPTGFRSTLESSTLTSQDSQPLARFLVHPQNVSVKTKSGVGSKSFAPWSLPVAVSCRFHSEFIVDNVQSRFYTYRQQTVSTELEMPSKCARYRFGDGRRPQ